MDENKYDIELEKKIMNLIDSNKDAVEIYNLVQNTNVKKGFPFIKTGLFVSMGIVISIAIYFFLISNNNSQQLQQNRVATSNNEELNKSNIQIESTNISDTQFEKSKQSDTAVTTNSNKNELIKFSDSLMLEFTIKVDIERFDIFDVAKKIREALAENNFKISSLETDRKKAFISTQIRKDYSYQQDTIIDFQYIFEINQSDKENVIKLKLINRNININQPQSRDYTKENTIENDFYLFMKNLIERYY